jgi:hypothetical protein
MIYLEGSSIVSIKSVRTIYTLRISGEELILEPMQAVSQNETETREKDSACLW